LTEIDKRLKAATVLHCFGPVTSTEGPLKKA